MYPNLIHSRHWQSVQNQNMDLSTKTMQHYHSEYLFVSIQFLRFGERFPALNNAYTKDLQKLAKDIGQELNFGSFLREGVYACVGGPTFETTAEVDYLRKVCTLIQLQNNNSSTTYSL